jgi:hypothetical protein
MVSGGTICFGTAVPKRDKQNDRLAFNISISVGSIFFNSCVLDFI